MSKIHNTCLSEWTGRNLWNTHTFTVTTLEDCTGQLLMINPCYDSDRGLKLDKLAVVLRSFCTGIAERRSDAPLQNNHVSQHAVNIMWGKMFSLCAHLSCQNVYHFLKRVKKHVAVSVKEWRTLCALCILLNYTEGLSVNTMCNRTKTKKHLTHMHIH